MSEAKAEVPAIQGWFEGSGDTTHLVGSRCTACHCYFFPKESFFCRNPNCRSNSFEDVRLSRTGTLWSFTNNCYKPPAPYVSPDPFVPYIVAAVELADEQMVVLGQVITGVAIEDLSAGMPMELTSDTLFEEDGNRHIIWKWKPAAA